MPAASADAEIQAPEIAHEVEALRAQMAAVHGHLAEVVPQSLCSGIGDSAERTSPTSRTISPRCSRGTVLAVCRSPDPKHADLVFAAIADPRRVTISAAITGCTVGTWKVANTWIREVIAANPGAHVNVSKQRPPRLWRPP